MFSITPSELLFIAVVALIVFGPARLIEMSRRAGKVAGTLRRMSEDLRTGLEAEIDEVAGPFRELKTDLAATGKQLVETAEGELRWIDTGETGGATPAVEPGPASPSDASPSDPEAPS